VTGQPAGDAVAWVVGGDGGIGGACATRLRADGYRVHASDRPEEDLARPGVAEEVAAGLAAGGGFTAAAHTIGMSGRSYGDGPVSACTDAGWDEVLRVNLSSAFWFLRACLRHAEDGASVVVVGSVLAADLDEDFLTAAYRVSKAALVPLVEAAAFEGAARGVRVNVVAPGLVDTPMAARALRDPAVASRFGELMPLSSRPALASEVAAAAAWLLSPSSGQTTGAVLPVDGGWSLRGRRRSAAGSRP
jgi:NAD(P)-dependent dehydrogenase (short-subunit alcohol dehydrogenase family)